MGLGQLPVRGSRHGFRIFFPEIRSDSLARLKAQGKRRRKRLSSLAAAPVVQRRNDLLPRLEIEQVAVADLKPPARNVRREEAAHIREVAASITRLGFSVPIVIGADNAIINGQISVLAARQLGLAKVPCIRMHHLSPTEQRVLRLALNRLAEKGDWNLEELKIEFEELILEEAPIEIAGFAATEIDQILLGEDIAALEQGPLEPQTGAAATACIGDIFVLGPHKIICGDATDPQTLARLTEGDDQARLILTDEPYNVPIRGNVTGGKHHEFAMASGEMSNAQFRDFNLAWMKACFDHLVDGGLLTTFIDWRGLSTVETAATTLGLAPINLIVWAKTNAGMGSLYRSQHELAPIYKKGKSGHLNNVELGRKGRWRSNLWSYPGASSMGSDARQGLRYHPTVKPANMLMDALLDVTARGELVIDPFLGSGSTLIAANRTGRCCRGVEIDPLC